MQGDLVEVAGNSVGTVSDIALTPQGQAQLTLQISNRRLRAAAPGDDRDDP